MIINPFMEGIIAVVLGAGLCVLDKLVGGASLATTGTLLMGAGAGYMLHALGGNGNGH